jgi:hypothetical protein
MITPSYEADYPGFSWSTRISNWLAKQAMPRRSRENGDGAKTNLYTKIPFEKKGIFVPVRLARSKPNYWQI